MRRIWKKVVLRVVPLNLMLIHSFLSGSVNYSTECSDDCSISDLSVSADVEVLLYRFEPEASDSESTGHGGEVDRGELDSLNPERVGNIDW